ncbi:hypothetical protein GUJ93_ZPchr0008g12421 [Zizania palustris]|uniref:Uncharacterized protein n=1 Tax=Zizania palustris TaxID=103762 RepID=A0A8J5RFK1_ZIZPA|nr:hypothetical protein GUJ93_ZPchr0008g12421 [Zizania palustris]
MGGPCVSDVATAKVGSTRRGPALKVPARWPSRSRAIWPVHVSSPLLFGSGGGRWTAEIHPTQSTDGAGAGAAQEARQPYAPVLFLLNYHCALPISRCLLLQEGGSGRARVSRTGQGEEGICQTSLSERSPLLLLWVTFEPVTVGWLDSESDTLNRGLLKWRTLRIMKGSGAPGWFWKKRAADTAINKPLQSFSEVNRRIFHHYYVNLKYEDDRPVDGKGVGRKVIDKLQQTYASELANKDFAYDGEKSLFTVGALPQVNNEFTVVLEDINTGKVANGGSPGNDSPGNDKKRARRPYQTKTFKVELCFAAKIPMSAIAQALRGQESENTQEAIRVIDIILRQHSAKQGCLLVRQSFFHNNPSNFVDLGGGVMGCRGFHSSFRATQSGLSLNIDVSTTMIVKPGPVIDFLLANQKVDHPNKIDWAKAKRALKNLRIKTSPANTEYKIVGLSESKCYDQMFTLKMRNGNGENGDAECVEVSVYDYFVKNRGLELRYSGDYPCINVGKPKRPTYFPIELCSLVPLQRYTKALNTLQRSSLVEKSRQKPEERMSVLSDVLRNSNYDTEPMLKSCGISISRNFTQVAGRVLQPPKLRAGNGEDLFTRNGRWNFNNKRLIKASSIQQWAVVNFSARCNIRDLIRDIIKCGGMKGIKVDDPFEVFEEEPSMRRAPPARRVDAMFDMIEKKLPGRPNFLLCVLAERKNSDIYGPWKRKCLAEFGIITQCVAPTRVNDQYITNVLLKINAKLGGLNSLLQVETSPSIPLVSKVPTIILGMDVSHGSPGQSDVPSIAAVVSSREWPLVSKYRASVRSQSPKLEMIDSLFKPRGPNEDDGLIRELLVDFYTSSGKRKPDQIIIFRDGVSESQFTQVLNIELDKIIEACKHLDENWSPKFTLIVAQKNHHTKFFVPGSPNNVPPGTDHCSTQMICQTGWFCISILYV